MPEIGRDGTEKPEVYAMRKGLSGRRLSRRDLLTAAVAALVTGVAVGCTKGPACKGIRAHEGWVYALAVSPDGTLLASGSSDRTIKFWSLPEGELLKNLKGHEWDVHALAVSPDGKLLASGDDDDTIKLWSLPEGEFVTCLIDPEIPPTPRRSW